MLIFIIYIIGVIAIALYMDHPRGDEFDFADRLLLMLLWPLYLVFGPILLALAKIIAYCVKERS